MEILPIFVLGGFLLLWEEKILFVYLLLIICADLLITYVVWNYGRKHRGWTNRKVVFGNGLLVLSGLFALAGMGFSLYFCATGPPDGFCFFAGLPFLFAAFVVGIPALLFLTLGE